MKKSGVYDEICGYLKEQGKEIVDFSGIMPNPTYRKVQEGAALAREKKADFILAVGGGFVIDGCKIIAAQAVTEEDIWKMEFSDHICPTEYLPMGAVVTASGTGAEMNNGAVITNEETKQKTGLPGASARFAVLDPAYTMSLPEKQVISGASAMGENGILKIGKVTDSQVHQMEHQLGAYTDCNHGQGLAVIHPVLYRHIYKDGVKQFARFAEQVWGISAEGKTEEELAEAGIRALADYIRKIGLPSSLGEMGITDKEILRKVADTCNITAGCCRKLSREEIYEILEECL